MASHSISSDSKELEKALRDLDPAPLDQDFLSRLESAADGTLTAMSAAEIQFEKSLRSNAPHTLSADFMARLESVVSDIQFARDEKIVLFPKTGAITAKPATGNRFAKWAAAAAVALIGGYSALLIPGSEPGKETVRNQSSSPAMPQNPANYVPAGSHLKDAIDEGVSWHQADKPHRVIRLTYVDRFTQDNEGKTIEVEQPRTEYIFVPEKMD